MAEVDFSDFEQAEAWFAAQTVGTRCTLASRAALRILANFRANTEGGPDNRDMALFRACLTAVGRGLGRPTDVDWEAAADAAADSTYSAAKTAPYSAARTAANSAYFAANSAADAAASADSAARSAYSPADSAARSAADSALSWDAAHLPDLGSKHVWAGAEVPPTIQANHDSLLAALSADPAWDFWRRFYDGMWNGTFTDWDLAIEVIKIDETDWEQGVAHIAGVIAGIEARLRTAVATPLTRDADDGAFVLQDEPPLPSETLEFIKERVGGALRTAIETGGSNGFDETCPEALAITKALESENPSAVAGLLNDACLMFQMNLGDRYPEDGALVVLQSAAFAGAEEICEADEVARERCLRASKLFLKEHPDPIDPEELDEFTDEVAREAEGEAKEIIIESGRDISRGRAVGRFIRARYAHYVATIVQWIDKTKRGVARVEWLWKMVRRVMDMFDDAPPPS